MTRRSLIVRYVAFAGTATLLNLIAQRCVLWFDTSRSGFLTALFLGTLVGLYVKYLLDRRWIFYSATRGRKSSVEFFLYTLTGVVTTGIFWGFEAYFYYRVDGLYSRELGAILGLTIGYVVKFRLDKMYVFRTVNLR